MKKWILVLMFGMIGMRGMGQVPTWAPTGAKWTYNQWRAFSSLIDTFKIRSIGDTIIQSKQCKVLLKSEVCCDFRGIKEFMYSDSGKVFFYDTSRHSFQMLYNFNAIIGDSIVVYPGAFPINDSIVTIIDSLSTITINTFILKKQYIHFFSNSNNYLPAGGSSSVIIEDIGDTYTMFNWVYGLCDGNYPGPLRCYEDTIIGVHIFDTTSCDYVFTGINDISSNITEISLYPNPLLHISHPGY